MIAKPRVSTEALAPAILSAVGSIHPGAFVQITDWNEAVQSSMVSERLMAALSAAFGILAAVLAAVGLSGLLAYTVARRTNEIGLRVAIGAGRGDIVSLVLGESTRLVIIGVVAGTALGTLLTRWTASLLYGLEPWDPMTFSLAPAALLVIGLSAALIPARRAASIDPALALRNE